MRQNANVNLQVTFDIGGREKRICLSWSLVREGFVVLESHSDSFPFSSPTIFPGGDEINFSQRILRS